MNTTKTGVGKRKRSAAVSKRVNVRRPRPQVNAAWVASAEALVKDFAKQHGLLLRVTERQLSASFEVGCFHAVMEFYGSQHYSRTPKQLIDGAYKYLTTPSGNPANFSYVELSGADGRFELRQQVRVESHVDPNISFTPDIVVLADQAPIDDSRRDDFAGGKRAFFRVSSVHVVAAHECKSTNPFPELLISFIGMLVAAHEWYPSGGRATLTQGFGHLAPTLFVGGTARALHLKMIKAMQKNFGMNIVCGLHEGSWGLRDVINRLSWSSTSVAVGVVTAPSEVSGKDS